MDTLDLLKHASLQLVAATKGSEYRNVVGYGTGFILHYKEYNFLITAAHVTEPDWSDISLSPHLSDNDVAIITGAYKINSDGSKSSLYIPVGGWTFLEGFKVNEDSLNRGQMVIDENYHHYVDLAFALLEDKPGYYSINENINLENADWTAPIFSEEHIATFDSEYNFDHYLVFGRTRFSKCLDTNGHPFIFSIPTCHCDMECISLLNDGYYCLKTTEDINIEEWRGISGAPVITQNGELLGIACAVFEEGKSFFVMDIHKVLPFLDIEILERNNK